MNRIVLFRKAPQLLKSLSRARKTVGWRGSVQQGPFWKAQHPFSTQLRAFSTVYHDTEEEYVRGGMGVFHVD